MNRRTHVQTVSHIFTWSPFYFQHKNAEILGLIAWAYLAAALLFVVFRTRPALAGRRHRLHVRLLDL